MMQCTSSSRLIPKILEITRKACFLNETITGKRSFISTATTKRRRSSQEGNNKAFLLGDRHAPNNPYNILSHRDGMRSIRSMHMRNMSSISSNQKIPTKKKKKTALIVGCNGALGSALVTQLGGGNADVIGSNATIVGADVTTPPSTADMDHFIQLPTEPHGQDTSMLQSLTKDLVQGLDHIAKEEAGAPMLIDVIVCAAGGWMPTPDVTNLDDYVNSMDQMMNMNLFPVLASTHVAATRMNRGGLFVTIGAAAALAPTPGMMAYGVSKTAVHHIVQTLGEKGGRLRPHRQAAQLFHQADFYSDTDDEQEWDNDDSDHTFFVGAGGTKGQWKESGDVVTTLAILPSVLDTPSNRANLKGKTAKECQKIMETWTRTEDVAKEVQKWVEKPALRPHGGSLIKVFPNPLGKNRKKTGDGDEEGAYEEEGEEGDGRGGKGEGAVFRLVR